MKPIRYLSVCSGIEAASVAWEPLGWQPVGFAEIEKFPSEVLAHHYGSNMPGEALASNGVPNFGDMSKFREWPDATFDLLVGGTPCQAFSVAGLRKGLDDPRGNLTLTYLGLVDRFRPEWVVWENVPGVLSIDGGRAFAAFLGGLAELGYGWAYRVLDAQFIRVDGYPRAVPQRRRRVFVVAHSSGDFRRAAAVLFEPESLRGGSPPSREAGQAVAPTISARPTGGGGLGTDFDLDGGLIAADVAPTLNAHFGDKQGLEDQHINGGGDCLYPITSLCLNAGGMGRIDAETETLIPVNRCDFDDALVAPEIAASLTRGAESAGKGGYAGRRQEDDVNLVAHALRGEGFDASEDETGRGTPIAPIAFVQNSRDEVRLFGGNGSIVGALAAEPGMKQQAYVAFAIQERAVSENPNAGPDGIGVQADIAYTLEARQQVQAAAYPYTLAIRGRGDGHHLEFRQDGTANAVLTPNGGRAGIGVGAIAHGWAVRRLTPTEAERLQGFPDGYTAITRNGKPAADGPRYKALGNSMAVNVMRWIGQRIEINREVWP